MRLAPVPEAPGLPRLPLMRHLTVRPQNLTPNLTPVSRAAHAVARSFAPSPAGRIRLHKANDDRRCAMPTLLTTPLTDPRRVEALRESGLMDTSPEESFDRVTRLTCKIVHVPAAMISLVDSERQFIKSATGLAEPWASGRSVPVGEAICRHVIRFGGPLLIADARRQEWYRSRPGIQELSVIAYEIGRAWGRG